MTCTPVTLHHGDSLTVLPTLADCSVDSIVTDPPYELGFMGKDWDNSGIAYNVELWRECLRVLKPGGHLLAFGGTRTNHRMAVAIEDAGFEIRDSIHWLYGSGFPKSLDVSKAIDKLDARDEQQARRFRFTAWVRSTGVTAQQIDAATATAMGNHYTTHPSQPAVMTRKHLEECRHLLGHVPEWVERECDRRSVESLNFASREVIGTSDSTLLAVAPGEGRDRPSVTLTVTAPATDAAKQWAGWGTALKPAHEPIVVARKPLAGTVAATVLAYGTGGLNIDGARVDTGGLPAYTYPNGAGGNRVTFDPAPNRTDAVEGSPLGRWPANMVLTHAADCADVCAPDCPVAELDQQSGQTTSGAGGGTRTTALGRMNDDGWLPKPTEMSGHGDTGGASRFFTVTNWDAVADTVPFRYVSKPGKRERNAGLDGLPEKGVHRYAEGVGAHGASVEANTHPTVKPVALMRWLVRLVTPTGGTVLDPFAGSGTTLVAARLEGFAAIGIEMTADYLPIIDGRLTWAAQQAVQLSLFGEEGTAA